MRASAKRYRGVEESTGGAGLFTSRDEETGAVFFAILLIRFTIFINLSYRQPYVNIQMSMCSDAPAVTGTSRVRRQDGTNEPEKEISQWIDIRV
jgi:hypothetical protein